jgi:hypothetical protein
MEDSVNLPCSTYLRRTAQMLLQRKKFIVHDTVYTRYRKDCIINQCPYVPLNDSDERSCYSTLLLHTIWPIEGEANILHSFQNAVECLRRLKQQNEIPQYVKNAVDSIHNSHVLRSGNTGIREPDDDNEHVVNGDNDDDDINDENIEINEDQSNERINDQMAINTKIKQSIITDGKHIITNISTRYN